MSTNMKVITKPGNSAKDEPLRVGLLIAAWITALAVILSTSGHNWSAFPVAVVTTLFEIHRRTAKEVSGCVAIFSGVLYIRHGEVMLWEAPIDQLTSIEVIGGRKRFGVMVSPKRALFRKRDGDLYSLPCALFKEEELNQFIGQLEQMIKCTSRGIN